MARDMESFFNFYPYTKPPSMLDVQKKRGTAPPNAVPTLIEQSNLKKYLETLGV